MSRIGLIGPSLQLWRIPRETQSSCKMYLNFQDWLSDWSVPQRVSYNFNYDIHKDYQIIKTIVTIISIILDEQSNIVFVHAYPASLESLEAECVERELEVSSFTIPVFALSHGTSSGLRIPLFPLEDKETACGLSVLPLFYVAGTAQPQFPSLRKIKNELFALQRVSPMPAHCKDKAKVRQISQRNGVWKMASRELEVLWPEPVAEIITGKRLFYYGIDYLVVLMCRDIIRNAREIRWTIWSI